MNVGDKVEIRLKTWWAQQHGVGAVFSGVVTDASPRAIEVDGTSFLRTPPSKDGSIPCRMCGRPLTEEASISIGYGPDCAVHLGLTNKFIRDPKRALTREEIAAAERRLRKKLWIPRSQIVASRRPGETVLEESRERRTQQQAETKLAAVAVATDMRHEEISDEPMPIPLPLGYELRPYQWRAVRFMLAVCESGKDVGPGVWDLMGLGKTIEAILFMMAATTRLAERGKHGPCVVVCPPFMTGTWKRTIEEWWQGSRVQVLKGYDDTARPKVDVYIVSWAILARGWEPLRDSHNNIKYETKKRKKKDGTTETYQAPIPDTDKVILSGSLLSVLHQRPVVVTGDEVHNAKNPMAQRSRAMEQLVLVTEYRTMMTGTAVLNRVDELTTQLGLLNILDVEFGGKQQFEIEFCNKRLEWQSIGNGKRRRIWKTDPPKGPKLVELHRRLVPYVIRRRTEHVLKDMPPLTVARVVVDLANREAYEELEQEIYNLPPAMRMGKLAELRQLCGIGKIPSAIEWTENFLECDEKLLAFAYHQSIQKALLEYFEKWKPAEFLGTAMGATPKKRQENMDRFQTDDACLLGIASSTAAREGITLTATANILDIELEWTPGIQDQKWKRAHRIGQTDPVKVWVLAAADSMDDTLFEALASKRRIAGLVHDGEAEVLTEEVLKQAVVRDLVTRVARRKKGGKVA